MLILTAEEDTASPFSIPQALVDSGKCSSSGGVGKRASGGLARQLGWLRSPIDQGFEF